MPTAVVLGASSAGSLTALHLSRAGWDVQVIDPELDVIADVSDDVAPRPGAPQLVQAHAFLSRNRMELTRRLPDVHAALLAAGVHELNLAERLPAHLVDGGRDGDEDLTVYQSRRCVFDRVVWSAVTREPRISAIRDRPTGLRYAGDPGAACEAPLQVTGVTLSDGTVVEGDVVIDAAGRRSPVHRWLGIAGVEELEEEWPCGVMYYGRHYRVGPGDRPSLNAGFASVTEFPTLTMMWFIGDSDTAMLALGAHTSDPVLRALRHSEALTLVARENPALAPWLELSEPTTDVFCMGAITSRMRRLVVDGRPRVIGLHHVGDALATTNPTRGRGLGMAQAAIGRLVDLLLDAPDDHHGVAVRYDDWIGSSLACYFREAAENDYRKGLRLRAGLEGGALPENAPSVLLPADHPVTAADIERAARTDPEVIRSLIRATVMLDDERDIAGPPVTTRVAQVLATQSPQPHAAPELSRGGLSDRAHIVDVLSPWQ